MIPSPYFSDEYYRRSKETLDNALEHVRVYKAWQAFDIKNAPVDERYKVMPILTKKDIRESFPGGLVPDGLDVEDALENGIIDYVKTSGTTEEVVTNIWNQQWWNASESASWKLNKHTYHLNHYSREAQLASAYSVGYMSDQDLSMQARTLERFLFLNEKGNANAWEERHYERMIRELSEYNPAVIEANPSLLARLSWWASRRSIRLDSIPVVLFTYELIAGIQLRQIRKVFPVPMAGSYGSTETGYVFMQCEHGTYHQNTDFCRVDFRPLKEKHGGPLKGHILVTTFGNPWTSTIRFDVGDLVSLKPEQTCACGRTEGYMLSAIEGRTTNLTVKHDGAVVTSHQLDEALSQSESLLDYQLHQLSLEDFRIRVIMDDQTDKARKEIAEILHSIYGPSVKVNVELCGKIEPSTSGKFFRSSSDIITSLSDILQ